MRTIIAGSRSITDIGHIYNAIDEAKTVMGIIVMEVVSGGASGVDALGEQWAMEIGAPIKRFPAQWEDLDAPGAVVRTRRDGKKYNVLAGFARNEQMAQYADALVAVWDGVSTGTQDMIKRAKRHGLLVYVYVDS